MKLPPIKRILREDLKDAPAWVTGLIDPLNSFMEASYQSLNRNITFTENIASFIKEITYKTTSAYPAEANVRFMNELKVRPVGVLVTQCYDKANYVPAPGPVYVPWRLENNGDIAVFPITGLAASTTYLIRLLIF